MKKFILFSLFAWAALLSCGEDSTSPDKDAPDIKKISPDTLSITGSLSVTFNEKIDTETVVFESIEGSFISSFKSATEVVFTGDTSSSGIEHFKLSSRLKFDIRNLSDLKDNTRGDLVSVNVPFYYWADHDAVNPNFSLADTLRDTKDLNHWKNGSPLSQPLTSEGKIFPKKGDNFDYKILALTFGDTVSITLKCSETGSLGFTFYGPFDPENFEDNFNLDEMQITPSHVLYIDQKTCTDKNKIVSINKHVMETFHHIQNIDTVKELFYIVEIFSVTNQEWGFYQLQTAIYPRPKKN